MNKFLVMAILACLGLPTAASGQPIRIGTSPEGTLSHRLGAALSKVLRDVGNIQSRLQPLPGSSTTFSLINSGEIAIGFASTPEVYDAFHGVAAFYKKRHSKMRAVGVIFPVQVGLVVRASSDIKSVNDMKGKRIAYVAPSQGGYGTRAEHGFISQEIVKRVTDALLASGGLSVKDLKVVMVPDVLRGIEELAAGRVDTALFAIGTAKMADIDAAVGVRFVALEGGMAAAVNREMPTGYIAKLEPAPNRAGVKEPMYALHYDYVILTGAHVPADRIKATTKILAENRDELAQAYPLYRSMSTERLHAEFNVPYHPGAVAYFNENGITPAK